MSVFDEILKNVTEDDKAVIAKYPQLQQTVTNLETAYADADNRLTQWETWKAANWDDSAMTTKQTVEAQERIRQLEAAGASDMTFDQIKEQLRKEGFVATKADIEAAIAPVLNTPDGKPKFISAEQHQQALNNLAIGFEQAYFKTAPLILKHEREFKEDLDLNALFKFKQDHGIADPEEAYNKMVAGRRTEAATAAQTALDAKHAQEIIDAEARGAQKKAEELAMSASGSPTDLGGPAPSMGHLDRLRMQEGEPSSGLPEQVQKARLGDMTTAQAAMNDWRSKRAGTVQ